MTEYTSTIKIATTASFIQMDQKVVSRTSSNTKVLRNDSLWVSRGPALVVRGAPFVLNNFSRMSVLK